MQRVDDDQENGELEMTRFLLRPFSAGPRRAHVLATPVALALAATLGVGCTGPEVAPTPPRAPAVDASAVTRQVTHELDDFHDAAAHSDEARYFAHFAERGVFLGTDAKERWDVPSFRAYAHPHFSTGHGWVFHSKRRAVDVSADGATAWFDEDLLGEKLGPARGSGVLVRGAGGRYLIAQYTLSLTIPNERFAEVRALVDAPPTLPLRTTYKASYEQATRAAGAGDLAEAHRLLAALVPQAKTHPDDDLEFWLHNELTWVIWAEGDVAGALDEVLAAKATLDHATLPEDQVRRLRLHELWDRAYLLLDRAHASAPADRAKRLAEAETARTAYTWLAKAAGDHDGKAVLDAYFAVRRGDAAAAKAAASQVNLAGDDDVQDLYVLALAFDRAKATASRDEVRAKICRANDYLMKPLILRTMKNEGFTCP